MTDVLIWPIMASFIRYVDALRAGSITVGGGARRDGDAFHFPLTSRSAQWVQFGGWVQFSGHGGMLSLTFGRPRIDVHETAADLTVVDSTLPDREPVVIAHIPNRLTHDELLSGREFIPRLTTLGSRMLGDVYGEGAELSPARICPAAWN